MSAEVYTLFLVLVCTLSWVGLDLLRKLLVRYGSTTALTFAMAALQIPLFLAWATWQGSWEVRAGYWLPGLLSALLNIVANLAYMRSVKLSPMSATLPLLSLTPAFAALLAIPLLAEVPSLLAGWGIVLVVIGAMLLNSDPALGSSPLAWWRASIREPGSLFMVLVALCWSLTLPLDKLAISHADPEVHALLLSTGVAGGLFLAVWRRRKFAELASFRAPTWRLLLAATLVAVLALALQLVVIQRVWVALLETAKRGVGSGMALLFGWLIFAEGVSTRKIAAVLVMSIGVWLVLTR